MPRKPYVHAGKLLSKSSTSARMRRYVRTDPEAAADLVELVQSGLIDVVKHGTAASSGQKILRSTKSGRILLEARGRSERTALSRIAKQRQAESAGPAETVAFEGVPVSVPAEVPERLRRFLVPTDGAGLLNATEAARLLDVARGTIYNWAARGILLAWQQTDSRLYIPSEQILGPHEVVPGLPELRAVIPDPRLLWSFLSNRQPFSDELARPIDLLRQGRVDDVVGAAKAFGLSSS